MRFEKSSHSKSTFDRSRFKFFHCYTTCKQSQLASMESASIQSSCADFLEPAQLNKLARGCYRCNGRGHGADNCFFKNFQCHLCGKLGHLKHACKSRTKTDQSRSAMHQNQEQGLKTLAHEVSVTSNNCFNLYSFMDSNKPLCITLNVKIDRHDLHKTKSIIDAVLNCKQPANVTELKSFLELVNYYHRFLPNLACTLQPLYEL